MFIKNRNLFRLTRFVLLRLPVLFQFLAKFRAPQKSLLIIKTDAIGDYILFRNFLEVVKRSNKFSGFHITLLGNELWKEIALHYDAGFVDDFIFTRLEGWEEQPLKMLKLGWLLFKNNYQVVLQPSFTRLFITDGLAGMAAAVELIGFESDNEGILPKYKTKTDLFYTRRLKLPPEVNFEFDRYRFFFQEVSGTSILIDSPSISFRKTDRKGIVIFPGALVLKRALETGKFLTLIGLITQHTAQPVYLAGGRAEVGISNFLASNLPEANLYNLTGKTSLPQLIELIGNASLVIANETSAIHIAAATRTRSVCILGGGHFDRFAPYPEHMDNRPVCVYEKMECFCCNWNCIFNTTPAQPYPCVGLISVDKIWQEVLPLLP